MQETIDAVRRAEQAAEELEKQTKQDCAAILEEARAKGSGVISLGGKMIDRPVVLRAVYQLELAKAAGVWSDPELVLPKL